jgi:hypothetical protein
MLQRTEQGEGRGRRDAGVRARVALAALLALGWACTAQEDDDEDAHEVAPAPGEGLLDTPSTGSTGTAGVSRGALSSPVSVSFQDGVNGYAGTRDTALLESAPTTAQGAQGSASVDGDEPSGSGRDSAVLLKWALSGIPAGSTVDAAVLTLRVTNASPNAYPLYALERAWDEATATWQRASSSAAWSVAGAQGAADRGATALGSVTASATGTVSVVLNAAGVARVQRWLDEPASNHGLVLASPSNTDGLDVATSEAAAVADRPRLTVTYRAPDAGGDPVLLAAGDIGNCSVSTDTATGNLLDGLPGTIALLGDIAYTSGTTSEFANCFDPVWGRHKARMRPSPGNHEYYTSGASGYYGYFGAAAGDRTKGYYSYDLGAWHVVVLNSNCASVGGCGAGSPQEQWLKADLAANPRACTLAYWHHPRFSSGSHGNSTATSALWQALDAAKADVVLTGHDHDYERFAPQDVNGAARADGIVQFVVGTGGTSLRSFGTVKANSVSRNSTTHGVLKLTLKASSYDWQFVPVAGKTWTDTGSRACR